MVTFDSIEEAVAALVGEFGLGVLEDTRRFIALLSDYAPNHHSSQLAFRIFARSGGFVAMAAGVKAKDPQCVVIARIAESVVRSAVEDSQKEDLFHSAQTILCSLENVYSAPLDPSEIHSQGMNYYRRHPKEDNVPVALLLFEQSSRAGFPESTFYIASSFLKGKGVKRDIAKGMYYLEKASDQGSNRAMLELADRLWKGRDVDKDVQRAASILKKLDDPEACFMLGELYRENTEYERAFEAYLLAAEKGHVYAQYSTAIALATGQGAKRDMSEAKKWLKSAASLGHDDARRKLAQLGERWD